MAEVLFRAKLQRDDSQNRWGFCLQGGADCKKPLTLLQVSTYITDRLIYKPLRVPVNNKIM